jgi:hypothetical protein
MLNGFSTICYAETSLVHPLQNAQQAREIMQNMIEANRCWLDPKSMHASYVISTTSISKHTGLDDVYSQDSRNYNVNGGGNTRERVGIELITPLHQMYENFEQYRFETIGTETIYGIQTKIIVAHTSDDPIFRTYTDVLGLTIHSNYFAYFVDTARNVVLQIRNYNLGKVSTGDDNLIELGPNYHRLSDGYAPTFISNKSNILHPDYGHSAIVKIEFQFEKGVWMLDEYEYEGTDIDQFEDYHYGWMKAKSLVVYSGADTTPTPTIPPFAHPTPTPVSSDSPLMERVIVRSQPWLNPPKVEAHYSIASYRDGEDSILGPYTVNEGGNTALRTGCLIQTPLHLLSEHYYKNTLEQNFAVSLQGYTIINNRDVIIYGVSPKNDEREFIGFGGQANKYVRWAYDSIIFDSFKVYVDFIREVPLKIETLVFNPAGGIEQFDWVFGDDFQEVSGGSVPMKISRIPSKDVRSIKFQFQVINGVWLLKHGDSWLYKNDPSDPYYYTVDLINFALGPYVQVKNWALY